MKFDFDNIKWPEIAFIFIALFSIIPLHLASFSIALPPPFRGLLDSTFKISFAASFSSVVVLVAFVSRYIPQMCFGVLAWISSSIVERKYYQRGYRRVYVAFTGFGEKSRKLKDRDALRAHYANVSSFDRGDARLANLKSETLQNKLPIVFYSENRQTITLCVSIMLFSLCYLGIWRGILVISVSVLFFASVIFYSGIQSRFRFNLRRSFWNVGSGEQVDTSQDSPRIDADDVLALLTTLAVAALTSGYLKVGHLKNGDSLFLENLSERVSIVAATGNGVIVYSHERQFVFHSWPLNLSDQK